MASLMAIDGSNGSTSLVISHTAIRKIAHQLYQDLLLLRDFTEWL